MKGGLETRRQVRLLPLLSFRGLAPFGCFPRVVCGVYSVPAHVNFFSDNGRVGALSRGHKQLNLLRMSVLSSVEYLTRRQTGEKNKR